MTWKRGLAQSGNYHGDGVSGEKKIEKKTKKRKESVTLSEGKIEQQLYKQIIIDNPNKNDNMLSLLSPELRAQYSSRRGGGDDDDDDVILPSRRKKKQSSSNNTHLPPLTKDEIKVAKSTYKNAQRKLAQLESRKRKKEVRAGLYKELETNTLLDRPKPTSLPLATRNNSNKDGNEDDIDDDIATANNGYPINIQQAQSLLLKSSELGKKITKKERLKHLRRKEALGIQLTQEEMDCLYVKYDAPPLPHKYFPTNNKHGGSSGHASSSASSSSLVKNQKKYVTKKRKGNHDDDGDEMEVEVKDNESECDYKEKIVLSASSDVKKNGHLLLAKEEDKVATTSSSTTTTATKKKAQLLEETLEEDQAPDETTTTTTSSTILYSAPSASKVEDKATNTTTSINFAQMMLSSLSTLKVQTDTHNEIMAQEMINKQKEEETRAAMLEEEEHKQRTVYIPSSDTITISTMHHHLNNNEEPQSVIHNNNKKNAIMVQPIHRPAHTISTIQYTIFGSAMYRYINNVHLAIVQSHPS
jgi:hypothetical protein